MVFNGVSPIHQTSNFSCNCFLVPSDSVENPANHRGDLGLCGLQTCFRAYSGIDETVATWTVNKWFRQRSKCWNREIMQQLHQTTLKWKTIRYLCDFAERKDGVRILNLPNKSSPVKRTLRFMRFFGKIIVTLIDLVNVLKSWIKKKNMA